MSTTTAYLFTVSATSLVVQAGVNGAALVRSPFADPVLSEETVDEWVMPSGNAVTVMLAWPPTESWEPGKASARIKLQRVDGRGAPLGAPLVDHVWPPPDGAEGYPHVAVLPFEPPEVPPARLWGDADRIEELPDADRVAILSLAITWRDLLVAGRVDDAMRLADYKWRDRARADGVDENRRLAAIREQYRAVLGPGPRIGDPVERDAATYDIICDGRVVHLQQGFMGRAITVRGPEGNLAVDVYAARIGGTWRIVR